MVNAMKMEAEMEQLLPLKRLSFSVPANVPLEEINLKPSADAVINSIVPIYCSGFIYGSLVESYSCEQNSRMLDVYKRQVHCLGNGLQQPHLFKLAVAYTPSFHRLYFRGDPTVSNQASHILTPLSWP